MGLTIAQKITFAFNTFIGATGRVFWFKKLLPSLVILVAQNVLVRTLNTNTISNAKGKTNFIPNILKIKESNNVYRQYAIIGIAADIER